MPGEPYSAERPKRLEFTIRELGDFTTTVKDIPIGQRVFIDGPYGTFGIECIDSPGCVFLAGGVGIAPIISMLRTLADRGDKRPLLLLYGSHDREPIIFREALEELEDRLNLRVVHVLEKAAASWAGDTGFITTDILERYLPGDRSSRNYLICGPIPMIVAMERALKKMRVPLSKVRSEQYDMA